MRTTDARDAAPSHTPSPKPIHPVWSELGLVTRTPRVLEILHLAETYAVGAIPVLILGETGTGKDLLAQGLHKLSGRTGRFVPVNCAAAHRELFVAELFGARRGAYTGASESRDGLIREAEGGTLFLDEIADLDPEAQGFLLRFFDSGEVRPLGENRSFRVETRVVAATCRDLPKMVAQGKLRRDLYPRLVAVVLEIPPLRERREDLELLIAALWRRHGGEPEECERIFTPDVIDLLRDRPWSGNVRDLSHAVAQAILFVRAGDPSAATEQLLEQAGWEWSPGGMSGEISPRSSESASRSHAPSDGSWSRESNDAAMKPAPHDAPRSRKPNGAPRSLKPSNALRGRRSNQGASPEAQPRMPRTASETRPEGIPVRAPGTDLPRISTRDTHQTSADDLPRISTDDTHRVSADDPPRIYADPPRVCPSCGRPPAARWVTKLPASERRSAETLRRALDEAEGSIAKAATILGISRSHAYRLYGQRDAG